MQSEQENRGRGYMRRQSIRPEERKRKDENYEDMIRYCRVNARAAFRRKPYDFPRVHNLTKGGERHDQKETNGDAGTSELG